MVRLVRLASRWTGFSAFMGLSCLVPISLFSLVKHLERLSKDGDPLEVLAGTVEFERVWPLLTKGLGYRNGAMVGRPPFDPVAMFKVLVVQAQRNLSNARMEIMIRDRLSWMRFFGFDLGGAMPDENTIRHFGIRFTESETLEALIQAFEQQLREVGYLAMGGQIVDATLVPAPKQRNTEDEKAASKPVSQLGRSGAASLTRPTGRMSMRAGRLKLAARFAIAPTAPQAQWQVDAREHRAQQCGKVSDPRRRRAWLCPS